MSAPTVKLELLTEGNIVVVGLGGIGSILARYLSLFLSSLQTEIAVVLVDGDKFEPSNLYRMDVEEFAEKAKVMSDSLTRSFGTENLSIRSVSKYITEENIDHIIDDGDIVFCCVDNHATRKLISNRCDSIENCLLISGGNDGVEEDGSANGTAGNAQLMLKRDGGIIFGSPLTKFHPEIENPKDTTPDAVDCMEAVVSGSPQLLFTNLYAASTMLNTFMRAIWPETQSCYDEVCFDILEGVSKPQWYTQQKQSLKIPQLVQ